MKSFKMQQEAYVENNSSWLYTEQKKQAKKEQSTFRMMRKTKRNQWNSCD